MSLFELQMNERAYAELARWRAPGSRDCRSEADKTAAEVAGHIIADHMRQEEALARGRVRDCIVRGFENLLRDAAKQRGL